jgi:hypothetical protein
MLHQLLSEIWRELAPHYFLADCFWRWLRFGGNWFPTIFQRIVLEAAQNWRELVPHNFPADCFGGSSDEREAITKLGEQSGKELQSSYSDLSYTCRGR